MMIKPTFKRYRGIILVGLPGAGKSTFGRVYAVHSVRTFIDLDRVVEQRAGLRVADIFAQQGEQAFRELEYEALQSLGTRNNFVLSLGGGTLTYQPNLELVTKMGLLVYLEAQPDVLADRIFAARKERPMFVDCTSLQEVSQKLTTIAEQRIPQYELASLRLRTDNGSVDTLKMQLWHFERRVLRMDALRRDFEIVEPVVVEGRLKRWFMSDKSPRFFAKPPDGDAANHHRHADKQRKPKVEKTRKPTEPSNQQQPVASGAKSAPRADKQSEGIQLRAGVAPEKQLVTELGTSPIVIGAHPIVIIGTKTIDKTGIVLKADNAPAPVPKKLKPRTTNPKAPTPDTSEPKTGIVLRGATPPISE